MEEEEFVCTNPGRPSPNSLLHNTRFYFFWEKLKMELRIGLKRYLLSLGWGIEVTMDHI
jgi:hypothetical protein